MLIKRGDIYYADLSPVVGSEQGGLRPVLIIQNDIGNRYSPTVIAAAITSRMGKTKLPTHIDVYADRVGLARDSVILLEQIRTLDKRRLKEKMGHLDENVMHEVNAALAVSCGLDDPYGHTREQVTHPLPHMPAAAAKEPNTGITVPASPAATAGSVPPVTGGLPAATAAHVSGEAGHARKRTVSPAVPRVTPAARSAGKANTDPTELPPLPDDASDPSKRSPDAVGVPHMSGIHVQALAPSAPIMQSISMIPENEDN